MPVTRAASNNSISNVHGPSSGRKKKAAAKPPAGEIIIISDSENEVEDVKPVVHHKSKKRPMPQAGPSSGSSKRARTSAVSDFSGIEVLEPPEEPPQVKEWKNRAQAAEHVCPPPHHVLSLNFNLSGS